MKIEKSNNPAATGALVLVLVLIVGRIGWMLFGQNKTVSAASTVEVSASSAPTATPASTPPVSTPPVGTPATGPVLTHEPVVSMAMPAIPAKLTARNPFTSLVPMRVTSAQLPSNAAHGPEDQNHGGIPLVPLPPLPVQIGKTGFTAVTPLPSSLPGLGVMPVRPARTVLAHLGRPLSTEPSPIQSLKLTALVDGAAPMAVVQTTNPAPVVLHVGDELAGMHVAAINEQGVVFTRGSDQWTLALQTAADSIAAGSVSVTPDATPEEKSDDKQ